MFNYNRQIKLTQSSLGRSSILEKPAFSKADLVTSRCSSIIPEAMNAPLGENGPS